ncbi:hypothetical protein BH09BAC6_BH09BAC6_16800 [soil metagenome]|jgi:hypothetical protein
MSKFALKEFNNVNGTITFFKIIEDGFCYWDDFCKSIQRDGTWVEQLDVLVSQMDDKANLKPLSEKKYKEISTGINGIKGFEFRTKDLRAYGIKDAQGNIIIYAGKKSTQPKDIPKLKSIVKRYLTSEK